MWDYEHIYICVCVCVCECVRRPLTLAQKSRADITPNAPLASRQRDTSAENSDKRA